MWSEGTTRRRVATYRRIGTGSGTAAGHGAGLAVHGRNFRASFRSIEIDKSHEIELSRNPKIEMPPG